MKPRSYSSEGIIIHKSNSKEADRMFIILSKKYGKQRFLAKGVRKLKSRKRGHLEIFSKVKFSAVNIPGMDLLTEVESINDYPSIRRSLPKMSLAFYFCEVIEKILREGEVQNDVLQLLESSLERLEVKPNLKLQRLEFVHDLLILLGFWSHNMKLTDADVALDEVVEKIIHTVRVSKKIL